MSPVTEGGVWCRRSQTQPESWLHPSKELTPVVITWHRGEVGWTLLLAQHPIVLPGLGFKPISSHDKATDCLNNNKSVLIVLFLRGGEVQLSCSFQKIPQWMDFLFSQVSQELYWDDNCAKCTLTVTFSPRCREQTGGGGGLILWWEAINLEGAAQGAGRLDLNGTAAARDRGLIVWLIGCDCEAYFLKPPCADQCVDEHLAKPCSFPRPRNSINVEALVAAACNRVLTLETLLLPPPSSSSVFL